MDDPDTQTTKQTGHDSVITIGKKILPEKNIGESENFTPLVTFGLSEPTVDLGVAAVGVP